MTARTGSTSTLDIDPSLLNVLIQPVSIRHDRSGTAPARSANKALLPHG